MDAIKRSQIIKHLSALHGNEPETLLCIRELSAAVGRIGPAYKCGQVALAVQMIADELHTRLELKESDLLL
jgi:hypothetical protein